jgi:hypothetical protein
MVKFMVATSEKDKAKHAQTLVNGRCEHAPKSGKQLLFLDLHSLWFVCFFKEQNLLFASFSRGVGAKGLFAWCETGCCMRH